jgi:hypothetical protein
LRRHESENSRSLLRALHELQRLQAARKGDHVSAPAVVDVDLTVSEGSPHESAVRPGHAQAGQEKTLQEA